MSTISAADVNKLRQMTGAGMMDCKKALTESNGDFEAAIDFLRKKGQKISANRADRSASEGAVIALTSDDYRTGVIIELNCETDFVAKNEDFIAFANDIAQLALSNKPGSLEELLQLNLNGNSVEKHIIDQMGKIGEKIEVSKYEIVNGEGVINYIHAGNKIGVLVEFNKPSSEANIAAGKDVAMQIAAMNPIAVGEDDVEESVKERELNIGMEQARAEGKPENMLENIAKGKLKRFFKDNTLLLQPFVKDSGKSVAAMLNEVENGLTVTSFKRVALGTSS